ARPAGPRRRRAGDDPGARAPGHPHPHPRRDLAPRGRRRRPRRGARAALRRRRRRGRRRRHDPRPLRPRHRPRPGDDPDPAGDRRRPPPARVASPTVRAPAPVHHRLVRAGRRLRTAIVCETGEARETHHIACLVGYGAEAINPYLMIESARELVDEDPEPKLVKALDAGLLKVLSKLGISTVASYRGSQSFEAVGLDRKFIDNWFRGTHSRLG